MINHISETRKPPIQEPSWVSSCYPESSRCPMPCENQFGLQIARCSKVAFRATHDAGNCAFPLSFPLKPQKHSILKTRHAHTPCWQRTRQEHRGSVVASSSSLDFGSGSEGVNPDRAFFPLFKMESLPARIHKATKKTCRCSAENYT